MLKGKKLEIFPLFQLPPLIKLKANEHLVVLNLKWPRWLLVFITQFQPL